MSALLETKQEYRQSDGFRVWMLNNPTGGNGLIATDKIGDKVWFFDPQSYRPLAEYDYPNHHEIIISADHKTAYVTVFGKIAGGISAGFSESGEQISVFDLEKRQRVRQFSTAPCRGPHGCRIDGENRMWVIFQETGELGLVDLNSESLIASYDINRRDCMPPYLELVPDQNKVYVSSKFADIVVFDTEKREVVREIGVPRGTEDMALSPDGQRLAVAENTEQRLLVIDTETDEIIENFPLKGAVLSSPKLTRLVRLRYSSDGRYLVSANFISGVVHIHDGGNLSDHEMIPVGKGPHGISFIDDNRKAIVTNHDCGVATILDLHRRMAVDWFEFGVGIEAFEFY